MVQIIKGDTYFRDIGESFGNSLFEGLDQRNDESAIRGTLDKLPSDASPRDVLNAITSTRASPEAKKRAAENYSKGIELEDKGIEAKAKLARETRKAGDQADKTQKEIDEANTIIETLPISQEEKDALKGKISPTTARTFLMGKDIDYKIAENQADRFEKEINKIQEKSSTAQDIIPRTFVAIQNNEEYGDAEKYIDNAIDAVNSDFLNQFKTVRGQELEAYAPIGISNFSTKMGGVFTNQKLKLVGRKAAGIGKDKNANRLLLYMDLYDKQLDDLRARFTNDIVSKSKYGLPPADFDNQLRQRMLPFQKAIDKDMTRLLENEKPISSLSSPAFNEIMTNPVPPDKVRVISPEGKIGLIPASKENDPKYAKYTRI